MTIYLDSSAALRWALHQPGYLDLEALEGAGVTSTLARTECWRSLDRKRHEGAMTSEQRDAHATSLEELFRDLRELELTRAVLRRAATPMAAPIATLDAIHLVTALMWREASRDEVRFATHDRELARAARLHGFEVLGV